MRRKAVFCTVKDGLLEIQITFACKQETDRHAVLPFTICLQETNQTGGLTEAYL